MEYQDRNTGINRLGPEVRRTAVSQRPPRLGRSSRELLDDAMVDLVEDARREREHLPEAIIEHVAYQAAAAAVRKSAANRVPGRLSAKSLCELAAEVGVELTEDAICAEADRIRENLRQASRYSDDQREAAVVRLLGCRPRQ